MQLLLSLGNETLCIQASSDDLISKLYEKVQRKDKLLLFNEKPLILDKKIKDYDLKEGSTIQVISLLKGGTKYIPINSDEFTIEEKRYEYLGLGVCGIAFIIFWMVSFIFYGFYGTTKHYTIENYQIQNIYLKDPHWFGCVDIKASNNVSTYLMKEIPKIELINSYNYTQIVRNRTSYSYFTEYLNWESQVKLNWTFDQELNFYLIKGTAEFNSFLGDQDSSIPLYADINTTKGSYITPEIIPDNYYFLFYKNSIYTAGLVEYNLNLTGYNLTSYQQKIEGDGRLCYRQGDNVVLYSTQDHEVKITYKPRLELSLPVFISFFVLFIAVNVIILRKLRRKEPQDYIL